MVAGAGGVVAGAAVVGGAVLLVVAAGLLVVVVVDVVVEGVLPVVVSRVVFLTIQGSALMVVWSMVVGVGGGVLRWMVMRPMRKLPCDVMLISPLPKKLST